MPVYEFKCFKCDYSVDLLTDRDDINLPNCPKCNNTMDKLLSTPSFVCKGSGAYSNKMKI